MAELPSTEEMLADLSKVPGLEGWFQIMAAVLNTPAAEYIFTDGEAEIIKRATNGGGE